MPQDDYDDSDEIPCPLCRGEDDFCQRCGGSGVIGAGTKDDDDSTDVYTDSGL